MEVATITLQNNRLQWNSNTLKFYLNGEDRDKYDPEVQRILLEASGGAYLPIRVPYSGDRRFGQYYEVKPEEYHHCGIAAGAPLDYTPPSMPRAPLLPPLEPPLPRPPGPPTEFSASLRPCPRPAQHSRNSSAIGNLLPEYDHPTSLGPRQAEHSLENPSIGKPLSINQHPSQQPTVPAYDSGYMLLHTHAQAYQTPASRFGSTHTPAQANQRPALGSGSMHTPGQANQLPASGFGSTHTPGQAYQPPASGFGSTHTPGQAYQPPASGFGSTYTPGQANQPSASGFGSTHTPAQAYQTPVSRIGSTHTPAQANQRPALGYGSMHTPGQANQRPALGYGSMHTPSQANQLLASGFGSKRTPAQEKQLLARSTELSTNPQSRSQQPLEGRPANLPIRSIEEVINWNMGDRLAPHEASKGRFWYTSDKYYNLCSEDMERKYNRAVLIMESDMGEQREDRCNWCKKDAKECWRIPENLELEKTLNRPQTKCAYCLVKGYFCTNS